MFFFEPYTPGEITFYALCYGGYKLHKKMKEKVKEYKLNRIWNRRERWLKQYLPVMENGNFERAERDLEKAHQKGVLTFSEKIGRFSLLTETLIKEVDEFNQK